MSTDPNTEITFTVTFKEALLIGHALGTIRNQAMDQIPMLKKPYERLQNTRFAEACADLERRLKEKEYEVLKAKGQI